MPSPDKPASVQRWLVTAGAFLVIHLLRFLRVGLDRHRGSGCPQTPATPPCVRVRTRRFEMVTLARILQIRETERFKIGRGKRDG